MGKKNENKVFAAQKRRRRQWLTFVRMCRYGVNNFTRNAWLTIAATLVMTITLLIIFVTAASTKVLNDSVAEMTRKVDMSVYLKIATPAEDVEKIRSEIKKVDNVSGVTTITPEDARKLQIENSKSSEIGLEAIKEATNKLPWTLRMTLVDINDTSAIVKFTQENELYKKYEDQKPSFITRKDTIDTLASWAKLAQNVGIGASLVFVAISSLIIFNTIRMAIFSRKDEIEMMKLIGADRSFIRGPFVVEAVVYGLIAAVLATAGGVSIMVFSNNSLSDFGVVVQPTSSLVAGYIGLVMLSMVLLGALIGTISSLLATRRYLKI